MRTSSRVVMLSSAAVAKHAAIIICCALVSGRLRIWLNRYKLEGQPQKRDHHQNEQDGDDHGCDAAVGTSHLARVVGGKARIARAQSRAEANNANAMKKILATGIRFRNGSTPSSSLPATIKPSVRIRIGTRPVQNFAD